jgi:hypothetical protein
MANRTPLDPSTRSEHESFPNARTGAASRSFGPSDSSDAGSDLAGLDQDDDSDRAGTGERLSAEDESGSPTADGDIGFDRVVTSEDAGLGGGLDQAEEARMGITDEEIEALRKRGR